MFRTFHESLRFPARTRPSKLFSGRDARNAFRDYGPQLLAQRHFQRSIPRQLAPAPLNHDPKNGRTADKVDLYSLGDGYTAGDSKKFEADARRLTEVLFATSPFKEHRKNFNVVGALSPPASRVSSDHLRVSIAIHLWEQRTMRLVQSDMWLTFDNRAVRKVAQFAPYEFIEYSRTTGLTVVGESLICTALWPADNAFANMSFVHEFGHHFAGLADE